LIEPVIGAAWNRAEIRKIIDWLERFPREQLDSHPHLSLYYSRALLHGGQLESADQRLREAETVLRKRLEKSSSAEDRLLLGTNYAFRTTVAAVSSEPGNALNLGQEALRLLPPDNLDMRAYVLNSMGVAHYHLGDMAMSVQRLTEGGTLAKRAGVLYPMMAAASFQAEALLCQGHLKQAAEVLRLALHKVAMPVEHSQSWTPAASLVCAIYGQLLYEWNRIEECECYLNEAIELGQQHAFGRPLWLAYHTLLRVKLLHGDQKGALAMFNQTQHYQRLHSLPVPVRLIQAKDARAHLELGQLENAERWARSCDVEGTSSSILFQEFERITLARIYLAQNQPEKALVLLRQLRRDTESSDRKGHLIEILALTALAQQSLSETKSAIETLHAALKMAEPEEYVRTFVDDGPQMSALLYQALGRAIMPDYIRSLLAAFPVSDTISGRSPDYSEGPQVRAAHEPLIEPLSERELEVLQLMASGASNQDIAGELIIAFTTAKKHVSNIIRKLGVENRTQAVAKGRNLGLCE
jgi:LuxR family maltose regulon positive regulatory protein